MVVQPDAKIFFGGSAQPVAFVTVIADPALFDEEKAKLAFQLITKKITADFPEIVPDRYCFPFTFIRL